MSHTKREPWMVFFLVVVICAFSYAVYQKEKLKSDGISVLLALAPVDPRSLMQGDYMRLRYALESEINQLLYSQKHKKIIESTIKNQNTGTIVISLDPKHVAQFIRFDDGKNLADNEYYLNVKRKNSWIKIKPHSFMFQEGHATYYQRSH